MFIRRLTIERYRGIEELRWDPVDRVNCMIGPGDSGKSTVLSAIERLLDPGGSPTASEFDYYRRRVELGFEVTAVIGDLDEEFRGAFRNPPLRGWLNGELTGLPDEDGAEAVIVARASGSPELDVTHTLVTSGEAEDMHFSQGLRRRLLFSRITSGGRAVSELRLGRGSLLDKHVSGSELQGQLRSAAGAALAGLELPEHAVGAIARLRELFGEAGLPQDLSLGMITPQGWSLLGLLGLVAGSGGEAIPLAFAGAGTRQLAMFRLAAGLMGASPIVVVDEPELGLEPYRQRRLVAEIREAVGDRGQAFLTTHSPAVLSAQATGEISRLALGENPVRMAGDHIARIQREAPDAFVSRLPLLCEGATEVGFLSPVLNASAGEDGLGDIDVLGVRPVSRHGQPQVLDEARELLEVGISIAVFVDNETEFSGLRAALAEHDRCAYGSWVEVRNVEDAVAMWTAWEGLPKILELGAELRRRSVEDLLQQVGEAIGRPGRASFDELLKAFSEEEVRRALGDAMQSDNAWFKSEEGGRALGQLLLEIGMPEEMDAVLRPFWARLREVAGWAPQM